MRLHCQDASHGYRKKRREAVDFAMERNKNSPYLPKSKLKHCFASLKTSVAYRVWKRNLTKYGGFKKKSKFKLLEVGSGPGLYLRRAERWFPNCEICGLDIDNSLVEFAKVHVKRATIIKHDGQAMPFPDRSFDVVVSLQVIEHLEKPECFFTEAYRILKENGLLLIATPNPIGISARILGARWQGNRYDHISLKSPSEWRSLIQNNGFQILGDGTTSLAGLGILQKFPLALINWIPMAIFGYFHWYKGESYMAIGRKLQGDF